MTDTVTRRKLIEVALPLDAINAASAREKSIRHGHPSTLHLWWARRPLAAARAVIFSQMVDDPSGYVDELLADERLRRLAETDLRERLEAHAARAALAGADEIAEPEPTLEGVIAERERDRLFAIIEELVLWESTTNEPVLERARAEIRRSWRRTCADNAGHPRAAELFDPDHLPAFHDPFAGGGALPLEAQRLGLEAHASDLNPVAVLINKAMIEIPPRFAGRPPVNPEARSRKDLIAREWKGAEGLAEDVRYYGQWMRDEAEKRIGHLYPKVEITEAMARERPDLEPHVGQSLTVIAWLWARTVRSPNPAFADVAVPLVSTFMVSTRPGKEAYIEPRINGREYLFEVQFGQPKDLELAKSGTKARGGPGFRCMISNVPIPQKHIRSEAEAGGLGRRLMAIVLQGSSGRIYVSPTPEQESIAESARASWRPDGEIYGKGLGVRVVNYGMKSWASLFTERQLQALDTFSMLINEVGGKVRVEEAIAGLSRPVSIPKLEGVPLDYGHAICIYLAMAVSRATDYWGTGAIWEPKGSFIAHVFTRNALPMTWDFPEANPFSDSSGNWKKTCVEWIARYLETASGSAPGFALQRDAKTQDISASKVVSTDPPYFDNIGYADLSDYFYVWLRKSLREILPDLFATVSVPKADELVATPGRHGGKAGAEEFFVAGMRDAMHAIRIQSHASLPTTIYYAFKQVESRGATGPTSTGWETFLAAVVASGFMVVGTWPIRTERPGRIREIGSNALASSIVLVCRPRAPGVGTVSRREFSRLLRREVSHAVSLLRASNTAPVDFAQSSIGPGMGVFSRYERVLDASGNPLSVRDALALINEVLDEALAEQEGDFDADSRWALAWFDQFGFEQGEYGVANVLAQAKNTSVEGIAQAGIGIASRGRVRLLRPMDLDSDWDPTLDPRLTAWEMVHHLVRALEVGGESAAAALVVKLRGQAEVARELCYRLYTLCERKKRAPEAMAYNALVQSWPEIQRLAAETSATPTEPDGSGDLFDKE